MFGEGSDPELAVVFRAGVQETMEEIYDSLHWGSSKFIVLGCRKTVVE